MTWEEELKQRKQEYLNDVESCIRILETLKQFDSPLHINSAKVTRARLMIHDILKKY